MFSRYNAMKNSVVKDPVDQDSYPDVLSLNYNNMTLSEIPGRTAVSKTDLDRFWVFLGRQYPGLAETDDVLLTINNVPYLGMLEPGNYLYTPVSTDLYAITSIDGLP